MAENTTQRQVILDFDLNTAGALKQAAELDQSLKQLKAEQKALDQTTEEGRLEYQRYNAEIKVTSDQLRTVQMQIANTKKANSESTGEIDKQRAKLAALTAEWRLLKKEDVDYEAKNEALQKAMDETNAKLKEAEEAHGDHRRSVGNYKGGILEAVGANTKFGKSLKGLAVGPAAWVTAAIGAAAAAVKFFMSTLHSTQATGDAFDQKVAGWKNTWEVFRKAVATVDFSFFIRNAKEAAEAGQKVQAVLDELFERTNSTTLQRASMAQENAALEESVRNTSLSYEERLAAGEAYLENMEGIYQQEEETAKSVRDAQLENLFALTKTREYASEAEREAAKQEFAENIKNYNLTRDKIAAANEYLEVLKKTESDVSGQQSTFAVGAFALTDNRVEKEEKALKKRQDAYATFVRAVGEDAEAILEFQKQYLLSNDAQVKAYVDSEAQYLNAQAASYNGQKEIITQLNTLRKQANDKQIADAQSAIDRQKAVDAARIKAEAGYLSDDFALRQQYAQRLQELENEAARKKLRIQIANGKITQAEYKAQLAVLDGAMKEFSNRQVKEANDYYIAQRDAILSMFDKTAQEQIDEVNKKYDRALDKLKNQTQQAPDASAYAGGADNPDYQKALKEYEDFLFQRAEIELRLERQKQKEIAEIQKNSLRQRAEEIEKEIADQYDGDLRRYQANERKKTEITIEQLKAQKAAKEKEGLDTYDEDAQLLDSQRRLNQMDLDSQLLAAGENARAIYEAKKRYIDEERKLAAGNVERQAELNAQALANEQEYMNARIEAVEVWANAAMNAMSGVNDLFAALDERRLQQVQEKYDRESEMLQEQLDSGLISQEVYEKKQKALDQDLEKEQKKIAREQAKREKAMAIFQIILDTSLGIMKAIAASPLTGGLPFSAIVGAMGAIQLATVVAQPLPKAARGRKIKGKSHAQGGELVVAEDGEIIMNKRSVSMFEPLLSEISVAGGGVPFSSHIPDGGYTARWAQSNSTNIEDLRDAMSDAVKDLKIYTAITDIRREDGRYSTVESRGSF